MSHMDDRLGRRQSACRWIGTVLTIGLLAACDSTAVATPDTTTEQLGPSVLLTNDGCTYAGSRSLSAEGGSLTIRVANDSEFTAVVSLLRVGSTINSVQADVDEYNDAESTGEPFELTVDPGVSQESEVQVDPSGEGELVADVVPDTYAVLCLGAAPDSDSEGLDEAFLFGPLEVSD
jgi:hypothetical protein